MGYDGDGALIERPERHGALFWTSAAVGAVFVAWGVRGALHHGIDTRPTSLARFFIGGALIHDLVVAPLVLLVGWAVARLVRGRWQAPLQALLVVSGIVLLFAWPEIRGYAHILHNPTSIPRNYAATAGIVIGLAAAVITTVTVVATRRRSS